MRYLIIAFCLIVPAFGFGLDAYWPEWFCLEFILIGLAAWYAFKKYHWSAGLVVASTLFSSLWVYGWRGNMYSTSEPLAQLALQNVAAQAGLAFILMAFVLDKAKSKHFTWIFEGLWALLMVHSLLVLFQRSFLDMTTHNVAGLFSNSSISATFIGVMFPLSFAAFEKFGNRFLGVIQILLPLSVVMMSSSSMGFAALIASSMAFL